MGAFSIWHIAIAVGAAVLLFGGGGKISGLMGDAAQGIRAFRQGLRGDEPAPEPGRPADTVPIQGRPTAAATRRQAVRA